jgi:hypothetical protein
LNLDEAYYDEKLIILENFSNIINIEKFIQKQFKAGNKIILI